STYCIDVDAAGTLVVSGGTDRMLRLFDPRCDGRGTKICKLDGHADVVRLVNFGRSAVLFSLSPFRCSSMLLFCVRKLMHRCVRLDENGTRVVSGASDGTLRAWDVRQQRCVGVYVPDGAGIWCLSASRSHLDTYYTGGRGPVVSRTDLRTGDVTPVAVGAAGVLSLAAAGQPSAFRRSSGGGGDGDEEWLWATGTSPDLTLYQLGSGSGNRKSGSYEHDDGAAAGRRRPLLDGPSCVVKGLPGVTRYKVLNDRRHLLTEDSGEPPTVGLWDVTRAAEVARFGPGPSLEQMEAAFFQLVHSRPWFSVDTRLGLPRITLADSNAFDGELFWDDATAPSPPVPRRVS
ncbi:unnamed protein product, partial [Phaeothamnion confervicola]